MPQRLPRDLARKFRVLLAQLAGSEALTRQFLRDADIPASRVDLRGAPESMWFAAIEEAEKHSKVLALAQAVQQHYESDPELIRLVREIAASLGADLPPPSPPPPPPPSLPTPGVDTTLRVALAPRHAEAQGLNGPQQLELARAIQAAFPSYGQIEVLLLAIDKDLLSVVPDTRPLPDVTVKVVRQAAGQGWEGALLAEALRQAPDSPALRACALTLRQRSGTVRRSGDATGALERTIRSVVPRLNVATFLDRVALAMRKVCCIRVDGRAVGTGFLVGPSAVLTNHHVVEDVLARRTTPDRVKVHFDFLEPGGTDGGVVHDLAGPDGWCIDHSPYASFERTAPGTGTPAEDELDYAVLRAAGEPGRERGAVLGRKEALERGWFSLWDYPPDLREGQPLAILQHSFARPLELAFDTNGYLGLNGNGTRLRYGVNTDEGASGSPVLDLEMALVGLHHGGSTGTLQVFNEGIPIELVARQLKARQKRTAIDE